MPFDNITQETDALSSLSSMPETGESMSGTQDTGGPGIDTPAEQQAVQMFIEGMKLIRQGAMADPSTKPIVDKFLQDTFLQLSQHYGYGEEGKMALKQAQMMQTRARSQAIGGVPGPGAGPPGVGTNAQPSAPPPSDMSIQY